MTRFTALFLLLHYSMGSMVIVDNGVSHRLLVDSQMLLSATELHLQLHGVSTVMASKEYQAFIAETADFLSEKLASQNDQTVQLEIISQQLPEEQVHGCDPILELVIMFSIMYHPNDDSTAPPAHSELTRLFDQESDSLVLSLRQTGLHYFSNLNAMSTSTKPCSLLQDESNTEDTETSSHSRISPLSTGIFASLGAGLLCFVISRSRKTRRNIKSRCCCHVKSKAASQFMKENGIEETDLEAQDTHVMSGMVVGEPDSTVPANTQLTICPPPEDSPTTATFIIDNAPLQIVEFSSPHALSTPSDAWVYWIKTSHGEDDTRSVSSMSVGSLQDARGYGKSGTPPRGKSLMFGNMPKVKSLMMGGMDDYKLSVRATKLFGGEMTIMDDQTAECSDRSSHIISLDSEQYVC